ncbi:MAG: carbohydrate-binding domain-containing protein [Clostridia bacterium]|nr:carbohydrate-binding domain-containing protein [Clostridia bacterium]
MKKTVCIITAFLLIIGLSSCAGNDAGGDGTDAGNGSGSVASPVTDASVNASEATGDFAVATSDGKYTLDGGVCTITSGGTYSLSGRFEGRIVVDAGDGSDVVIELNGVTVIGSDDSPVKILSAGDVDISAKKGTENLISDTRTAKTADDASQGEGAISSETDLKLKGTGTLVVSAGYNNGIHTAKDLKIQKLSLKVTAPNNALRGGDSVEILSGTVIAISTGGDGIKTVSTDTDKSGNTRGDVLILGGSVAVYAAGDGIQAAHSFALASTDGEAAPSLSIYTGSYSGYTASSASVSSYKGIKAQNELTVSAGLLTVQSYDDGLHADIGTVFEDGTKGLGAVSISGGSVVISVYSPENKTFGGRQGPGGRQGFQQATVSGADGIHSDGTLSVSGGNIVIDSAYEGLEANVIEISGGNTKVAANDDGINACRGASTPLVSVSGGFLDVSVPAGGDTDGIDSNGSYRQTGGIVIARGPNSEMAAALDADGTVTVSGGTLIILGYGRVSASGGVSSYSLSLHSAGSHTVTVGTVTYTFENSSSYGRTVCYSDVKVSS